MTIKGSTIKSSGRVPAMAKPHRVPSGSKIRGQMVKTSGSHTSAAGGFTASRKKGSIRG